MLDVSIREDILKRTLIAQAIMAKLTNRITETQKASSKTTIEQRHSLPSGRKSVPAAHW